MQFQVPSNHNNSANRKKNLNKQEYFSSFLPFYIIFRGIKHPFLLYFYLNVNSMVLYRLFKRKPNKSVPFVLFVSKCIWTFLCDFFFFFSSYNICHRHPIQMTDWIMYKFRKCLPRAIQLLFIKLVIWIQEKRRKGWIAR